MSAMQQQAFRLAAAELGMASAAWLFVQETAAMGQTDEVALLRDEMGRAWPVLDAVCANWLAGTPQPQIDVEAVRAQLQGASRLVLVGYESTWLDALLPSLPPALRVAVLTVGDPLANWDRMLANHGTRVEPLRLEDFQSWAGPRSVLLTFVYGAAGRQIFVVPSWLRVSGLDVRLQFRSLLGWRILDIPMEIYPRWLVAADADTLTDLRPAP